MHNLLNYGIKVLTALFLVVLGGASLQAQNACTNENLHGAFGFKLTGTFVAIGQFAFVGTFSADGKGSFNGRGTESVEGDISQGVPFAGTYTVNRDCSGSATLVFPDGSQSSLDFVLLDHGSEVFMIDSDQGTIETGIAKRLVAVGGASLQAQNACTNENLHGAFGFKLTGTFVAIGQFAFVGTFSADGKGSFNGRGTESVEGDISQGVPFAGTYTVNRDCSGSATLVFPDGSQSSLDFVLLDHGSEVFMIDSDQGTIETGIARRQF